MRIFFLVLITLFFCRQGITQENLLLRLLDDSISAHKQFNVVMGTFKATQIVNLPTVEAPGKHALQFLIMHRFGRLNEGAYQFFGLDNASIRFSLDYGVTNRLSIGLGRSSWDKVYDGAVKYKLIQQRENACPFSVSLYELLTYYSQRYSDKPYLTDLYRLSYTSQLLIASKITRNLSLELVPAWIHNNMVHTPADKNDAFVFSGGGRMKLSKRLSLSAEYNVLLPNQVVSADVHNSLSLGLDIETGGHVFQLTFSNSQGMAGPWYLDKTAGSWRNGDIYFGFNISRSFNLNSSSAH